VHDQLSHRCPGPRLQQSYVIGCVTHTLRPSPSRVSTPPGVGRDDRQVVIGAHLDSVLDGAGLNDNGSGSSGILEIVLQYFKTGAYKEVLNCDV
jgi:Zn-dependent M28 family amino/carboxypeptidase